MTVTEGRKAKWRVAEGAPECCEKRSRGHSALSSTPATPPAAATWCSFALCWSVGFAQERWSHFGPSTEALPPADSSCGRVRERRNGRCDTEGGTSSQAIGHSSRQNKSAEPKRPPP